MTTQITPAQALENIVDYLLENRRDDVDYDDRELVANSVNTLAQEHKLPVAITPEQLDMDEDEEEEGLEFSSY